MVGGGKGYELRIGPKRRDKKKVVVLFRIRDWEGLTGAWTEPPKALAGPYQSRASQAFRAETMIRLRANQE